LFCATLKITHNQKDEKLTMRLTMQSYQSEDDRWCSARRSRLDKMKIILEIGPWAVFRKGFRSKSTVRNQPK
jgi:hypothetical protein